MALHRGIQSAIFYYLSCTPCAEMRVRKKRKQEAERDRVNRAELEARMPGLYRQPEPSATNPYWQAEIEAGPIPMRTRKKTVEGKALASSTKSNIASSISVNAVDGNMERTDSAKSGLGPHQRDDEVLWGAPIPEDDPDLLPVQPPKARLADPPRSSYGHSSNAAINDMHPPTTRKVRSKDEVMWMLQPPPIPEVMSGKSAAVTRSNSGASRPSTMSSTRMSTRTNSTRARGNSTDTVNTSDQHKNLQPASQGAFLSVPETSASMHRSRTSPGRAQNDSAVTTRRSPPTSSSDNRVGLRTSGRPGLNTILSDSLTAHSTEQGKANSEDLRPGTAIVSKSHRIGGPRKGSVDEYDPDGTPNLDNFESWNAPEFEPTQWIHEHTKREVRERWSFDM